MSSQIKKDIPNFLLNTGANMLGERINKKNHQLWAQE